MSGPAELSIAAGVLVDAGAKATVGLLGAWLASRCMRSAAQRHAVWVAFFVALPVLPLVAWSRGPSVALELPWLVALWLVGSVLASLPLLRGLLGLRRLRASAWPDGERGVLRSDRIGSPITWGLLRPVVVLPDAASSWPETHRDAALAHERAHIARRDWAVHIAVWAVCVLFWFHPGVWWARRQLARQAECAADDLVLSGGVRPSDYATLLLAHARSDVQAAALAVAPAHVGMRVRAVLEPRSRSARRWPVWMVALGLSALLLPALGASPLWAPSEPLTCEPGLLP